MATLFVNKETRNRSWHLVDAGGKTMGRLASRVATLLMGKHKPEYTPNCDSGDFVVIINADKITLSGEKWDKKIYKHHTMYPGGLREEKALHLYQRSPVKMLEKAIRGMLPKNKIGDRLIRKVKVYTGDKHPHSAQKPETFMIKG